MTYKGWRILAVIYYPHFFNIANTGVRTHNPLHHIKFGKEVPVRPPYKPQDLSITKFCADKEGEQDIYSYSVAGLKKIIDEKEDSP